jgi:hypothetical protein
MVEELIKHNEDRHMSSVRDVLNLKFMQASAPLKKQIQAIEKFTTEIEEDLERLVSDEYAIL